jgi:hypothetical protein
MMMLVGLTAQAAVAGQSQFARVTVCVSGQSGIAEAEPVAWSMFHSAGVTIDWHAAHDCPAGGIVITQRTQTPANLKPGALAYALPYEGTHIEIFYDRIERAAGNGSPAIILAHVMAHEVTHILQGVARHSASGVMKANFTSEDFRQMQTRPMRFTADDIDMIRLGFEKRQVAARGATE